MTTPNTSPVIDIWQEYDCPNQLTDMDISGDDILIAGQTFYCCICGQDHTTEQAGVKETNFLHADPHPETDSVFEFRGVPADAAEKALWLQELKAIAP